MNMGPFYHLIDKKARKKCLEESLRVLKHNDPNCFWTDTYYSSYDEMQELFRDNNLDVVMHFAQDGMSPLFHNTVDMWNDEQFDTWLAYHLSVCAEKTIIDMSNHVVIIGKKN